ncbi:MAG: hypothetical protein ACOYZ8_07250 [Chloroflexota bacterium]
MPTTDKRPLKVFLCHAHADRDRVHALDGRVALSEAQRSRRAYRDHTRLTKDGVDAWLDKEKPCGEPRRTILPGQDWEFKAV